MGGGEGGAVLGLKGMQVVPGAASAHLDGVSDIELAVLSGQVRLYALGRAVPGIAAFSVAEAAPLQIVGQIGLLPSLSTAAVPQMAFVASSAGSSLLVSGLFTFAPCAVSLSSTGGFQSSGYWTDANTDAALLAVTEIVQTASATFMFATQIDASGLSLFSLQTASGTVTVQQVAADTIDATATVSDVEVLQFGTGRVVVAAVADQDRIVAFSFASDGRMGAPQSIGAPNGLGISVPADMAKVSVGQIEYLLLASAQSSTISVFLLDSGGQLVAADNVVDSLTTRFAAAARIEAVSTHGRGFVVASGSDDGLSLFTVLPGGRLLHLTTLADSAALTLDNISALAMVAVGQELQVFAASGSEAGLSRFTFDLSRIGLTLSSGPANATLSGAVLDDMLIGGHGDDVLSGGSGDDILVDGAGADSLAGGAGSDLFVLASDGQRDVILDFTPGSDRLDLSAFDMLYSVAQIVITPTIWGARLEYQDEITEIHSASGQTIFAADFTNAGILNLMRSPGPTLVTVPRLLGTESSDTINGGARNEIIFGHGGADRLDGRGGDDIIYGGASEDWLNGDDGNDLLYGEAGSDTLLGGSGNDTLLGGDGDDTILGGGNEDAIDGGLGADALQGDAGFDTIDGGAGNDTIFGGLHADSLRGGAEDDLILGEAGVDNLFGDDGNDSLYGGSENDWLRGGAGDDLLRGGAQEDRLFGEDGNDLLYGEGGFDRLEGGAGADTLHGGGQADNLFGQDDDDVLCGDQGLDRLFGGNGNDWLDGGTENDGLFGEAGDDTIIGGSGTDRVFGGAGNDLIDTGADNDTVNGGAGYDTITGGAGDDELWGRFNADTFIFAAGFGRDRVMDFDALNALERIDLSGVTAIADLADLLANHARQAGADVVIDDLAGNTITLVGVKIGDLDATDFLF